MKLLAAPASPYSRKVRIVLAEKRIECEIERVDVQPQDNPVNTHNALGKIPTLLLDDGTALFDSRVIVEFLDNLTANSRLIPQDNRERIAVRRWEALADGVLDAGLLIRYESLRPEGERSAPWTGKQAARVRRGLAQMEAELGGRAWCQGERYTLADIALGCCVGWVGFRKPAGIDWRAACPALARHYDKLMERPAFAETVPAA
ncbi:MAG TPA: glutathione S-transferase N-terminal domain-containing protein [Burkholderiales bacterium]|nr:glutathione S-transferase N-terminal domain-containing protein [Burkholderiales bacterium]